MALYVLSPVIAELCLGSSPPLSFLLLGWAQLLLYGGGAILIRELTLRWGKGWPTILALGVAYAIAEEGVAVRTFFDPTFPGLQELGDYGWALGANWVWIVNLCLYHSIVSIAIPIGLVGMAFPERAARPWVNARWLRRSTAGYVGVILFWLLLYQRPVDGLHIVASLVAIAAIVALARVLPARIAPPAGSGSAPAPRLVAAVVIAAIVGVFALELGHGLGMLPIGAMAGMVAIAIAAMWWLARGSQRPGWSDRQRFAVAAGVFVLMALFSLSVELSGGRGQLIVGAVTAWLTWRIWRRLADRERGTAAPPAALSAAGACRVGGSQIIDLSHGGRARPYILHVPAAAAGAALPLLLQLHGRGIDPVAFDRLTGFRALADTEGFVVAMPAAIGTIWNDGRYPEMAGSGVDDVGYLLAVLDDAALRAPVDPARVYAVGMSNGATMAGRLACEQAERLAGLGQVAGTAGVEVARRWPPRGPLPVIEIHGSADLYAPYAGGSISRLRARVFVRHPAGPSVSVDDWAETWVRANGAQGPTTERLLADTTIRRWQGPTPLSDVAIYRVEGGGHTWPGSGKPLPGFIFGPTTRTFYATRVLWEFLAAHSRDLRTAHARG
jgi:polyhydroxybutyrate depolymerase